jgi:hypothetical protein
MAAAASASSCDDSCRGGWGLLLRRCGTARPRPKSSSRDEVQARAARHRRARNRARFSSVDEEEVRKESWVRREGENGGNDAAVSWRRAHDAGRRARRGGVRASAGAADRLPRTRASSRTSPPLRRNTLCETAGAGGGWGLGGEWMGLGAGEYLLGRRRVKLMSYACCQIRKNIHHILN